MKKRILLLGALLCFTAQLVACDLFSYSSVSEQSSNSSVAESQQSGTTSSGTSHAGSATQSSTQSSTQADGSSQSDSQADGSSQSDSQVDSSSQSDSQADSSSQSSESSSVEKTEFLVVFDTAGGTAIETQTVAKGGKIVKPTDPTKTDSKCDYVFAGWYVGDYEWNFETDIVTDDITLTAKWNVDGEYTNPFLPSD